MTRRRYSARCHCGLVRFAFWSEEITRACRCNCSICVRKGAVVSARYVPAEDFEPPQDTTMLADYRWSDGVVNHLFCRRCGIYPFHGDAEQGYRVNLGCVDDLDVLALEIDVLDGRSFPVGEVGAQRPERLLDFPSFLQSARNRIDPGEQYTDGIEGWSFTGADGAQVALWRCRQDHVSREHAHAFDEYVVVIAGRCSVLIDGVTTELQAGDEMWIPRGTRQRMSVTAGTRTLHVFGGARFSDRTG